MKKLIVLTVCICLGIPLVALGQLPRVVFPPNPTPQELAAAFKKVSLGRRDLFQVLSAVHERGDNAVAGLSALLLNPGLGLDTSRSVRLCVLMSLEGICSPPAVAVLMQAARSHRNAEVRGVALNTIATRYYEKVLNEQLTPSKEIVHLLMGYADDTTDVDYLHLSFGQIARIGVQSWMGRDFGEPEEGEVKVNVGANEVVMTLKEYREFWWQRYGNRLRWNAQSGHFEMP